MGLGVGLALFSGLAYAWVAVGLRGARGLDPGWLLGAQEDALDEMKQGGELVSASFVIPYPPGFPVLVPGQVINKEIIDFLIAIDVKEIHGYRPELGLRVFTDAALGRQRTTTAMGGMKQVSSSKSQVSSFKTSGRKKK